MKQPKQKKQCGNCKFVDRRGGVGNWTCGSPRAYSERSTMPKHFPRVFTNDSCKHWVDEAPPAPVVPEPADAAEPES